MSISRNGMRIAAGIGLAALIAIGCNNSAGPTTSAKGPILVIDPGKPAKPDASLTKSPAAAMNPATGEAGEFLKALTEGRTKDALARVAVSFRKDLSGPLTYEEEKKLGYSDSDTEKYLREAVAAGDKAEVHAPRVSPSGNEVSFRGSLSGKETKLYSLRMAKEGDGWKVTRFIAGRILGRGEPTDNSNAELTWARETAEDFLESLIASNDDHAVTMSLMTEKLKAHLPAPSVADPGLGYAKKDIRAWLNKVRTGVKGYAINTQKLESLAAGFTGDLVGPGKSAAFQMNVVREGDAWKVDQFDVK